MINRSIPIDRHGLLILAAFFLLLPGVSVRAQEPAGTAIQDTLIIEQAEALPAEDTTFHSPKKATLYTAILPGLGQIYNRKYWKVPIVYVGIGTLIYFIDYNSKYYKDLKEAMIDFPDYNSAYYPEDLTYEQLEQGKDYFKRWRDLSIIGTVGFYVLQIIDASVDAHLYNWEVGEDISLQIEPVPLFLPVEPFNTFGLRACISF